VTGRPPRDNNFLSAAGGEIRHQQAPTGSPEDDMARGEKKGNREAKKPKKEKPKTTAAAPTLKGLTFGKPPGGKA
jgi:hypothetical protein